MRFILDEKVIIGAYLGQDDRGQTDFTCAGIVASIVEQGHSISLTPTIWAKYAQQIDTFARTPRSQEAVEAMSLLHSLLADASRGEQLVPEPPAVAELAGQQGIDQGDRVFVELACHIDTGIRLITTDSNLAAALRRANFPARRGFLVDRPEDARALFGGIRP